MQYFFNIKVGISRSRNDDKNYNTTFKTQIKLQLIQYDDTELISTLNKRKYL